MKIKTVTVEYKELRSSGYPNFSNATYGMAYSAEIDDGENIDEVKRYLLEKAIREVKLLHGEKIDGMQLNLFKVDTIPF